MKKLISRIAAGAAFMLLAALLSSVTASPASASTGGDFNPGNIISDANFFNGSAMDANSVQAFLNAQVPTCRSGYTCLKDYRENTWTRAPDAMCTGYNGAGGESAALIIARVGISCNISQKVLLVLLQKEQSLVTDDWPGAGQYRSATGFGCPDTAPCDSEFYGFYNQVYKAAWQYKRYANPPGTSQFFTWFPVGATSNVLYSPDGACGSSPVFIQNQATAGLYYYTPYQPNAAALSNLYGDGDDCSSYGNRNFWRLYSDWFGAPSGPDGAALIAAEYAAQGGSNGFLGAGLSGVVSIRENGGGMGQAFQGGSIYWSVATGAKTVRSGPLRDYYFARNGAAGPMGWPAFNQSSIPDNGGGTGQLFTGGSVYSSAAGTFLVKEPIRSAYFAQTGAAGAMGWPTADLLCGLAKSSCVQTFQSGSVYWSQTTATHALWGSMLSAYQAAAGPAGTWGLPQSDLVSIPQNGGGSGLAFTGGSLYLAKGGSPHFVSGAIRDFYFRYDGARGTLGFPSEDAKCDAGGTCSQAFQYGSIISSPPGGTRLGLPEINAEHDRLGGNSGVLGPQTSVLTYYGYNGGGLAEGYAGGAIFWKKTLGAFAVTGAIRDAYFAQGGAAGSYGWPSGRAQCGLSGGGCSQTFEGATIYSSSAGAFGLYGPIRDAYNAAGGSAGSWGWPVSPIGVISQNGSGVGQAFTGDSVYVAQGGTPHRVSGAIRDLYFQYGGAAGSFGFPTGDSRCASDGTCSQAFQFSSIVSSPSGTRIASPEIDAEHNRLGGDSGVLGSQTSALTYYSFNGGGLAEGYAGGAIYWKQALGAFAVTGFIRDGYFTQSGAAGSLGWPKASATCGLANGGCSQPFEGAVIYGTPTTGAFAVTGSIAPAYTASGPGLGVWGWPISPVGVISENGAGVGQAFTGGSAYVAQGRSARFVSGKIRDFYFGLSGAAGTLGFPTGDVSCGPDGACSQLFQHGSIISSPMGGTRLG